MAVVTVPRILLFWKELLEEFFHNKTATPYCCVPVLEMVIFLKLIYCVLSNAKVKLESGVALEAAVKITLLLSPEPDWKVMVLVAETPLINGIMTCSL